MSSAPQETAWDRRRRRLGRQLAHGASAVVNLVRPLRNLRSLAYHAWLFRLAGRRFAGLHLGAGGLRIDGFLNLDASVWVDCDVVGGVRRLKLATGSVQTIYASHVFEHIRRRRTARVLAEWHRVLEPGGRIFLCVPDLEALSRVYLECLPAYAQPEARSRADLACCIIYGGQTNRFDYHFHGYSFTTLEALLRDAGFQTVRRFERAQLAFAPFRDAAYATVGDRPVSLNIEAIK